MNRHPARAGARAALMAAAATLAALPAFADVKPDPGDYTALPEGTNLGVLYYQHHVADDIYFDGDKVASDAGLSLDVGILRYVHFTKLGGYTIDPQIIAPFGRQQLDLTDDQKSGIGDVIFGATLWLHENADKGDYFGLSTFFTAPTGAKKNGGFALSNNRWAVDLQAGYITRLAPQVTLDLIGEVELYQDQRDTDAEKDPLLQTHAILRYHPDELSHLGLTWRHAAGAEEKLGEATLSTRRNDDNLLFTWARFLSPRWQLQLQYSHDLQVENGPKTQGFQSRLLYVF